MNTPTLQPIRRIAVIGAGKIGSTFALHLARVGHEVTVIARPGSARLGQLRRDGAIVPAQGARAAVRVAEALDPMAPYDLVLVTLLAHQVDAVLPVLQQSAAGSILFMFNTFDPPHLEQGIGADRCALGMPFVQAMLDDDGVLVATVGATGQRTLVSDARWADLFNAAGLPAVVEAAMPLWLRSHAPLCVAFESVSVAGVRRGGGASWREARTLARGVKASFGLIEALGLQVYPRSKRFLYRSPIRVTAALLWSMSRVRSFRELLATGEDECVALIGAMETAAITAGQDGFLAEIRAMTP